MVGPNLSHTALRFQEPFYKNPPTNAVAISVVDPFRRSACVFTQWKSNSGRSTTICKYENHGRVLQTVNSHRKEV